MIHDLDEKILAVCKVEDIEKEMRVMDAIEAISLGTTPTTPLTSKASSNLRQGNNALLFLLHHLDYIQRVHNNLRETLEHERNFRD